MEILHSASCIQDDKKKSIQEDKKEERLGRQIGVFYCHPDPP